MRATKNRPHSMENYTQTCHSERRISYTTFSIPYSYNL